MRLNVFLPAACLFILAACNNNAEKQAPATTTPPPASMTVPATAANDSLKKLDFAVKKDLVCGMPVHAGITDTLTYKGKLYGFCSPECKAEFQKSPDNYIAAAK